MKFSAKLSIIIRRSGDRVKVFSDNCGKDKTQIYNYLNDKQLPGMDFFKKMKKAYPWVNLDDLIDDQKDIYFSGDGENEEKLDVDPKITKLLSKAKDVLLSGTDFSFSLSANIRSFHNAIMTQKRLNNIELRLTTIEQGKKEGESRDEYFEESIGKKVI